MSRNYLFNMNNFYYKLENETYYKKEKNSEWKKISIDEFPKEKQNVIYFERRYQMVRYDGTYTFTSFTKENGVLTNDNVLELMYILENLSYKLGKGEWWCSPEYTIQKENNSLVFKEYCPYTD